MTPSQALEQKVLAHIEENHPAAIEVIQNIMGMSSPEQATQFIWLLNDLLQKAETVYWSKEMTQMLMEISSSVPDTTLTKDLVPFQFGFMYFESPLTAFIERSTDTPTYMHAISWALTTSVDETISALAIVVYIKIKDRHRPIRVVRWHVGETITEFCTRMVGSSKGDDSDAHRELLKRIATAFLLMNQQIIVAEPSNVERHIRKRLHRASPETSQALRVIKLRRVAHRTSKDQEPQHIEWNWRWVVRSHWRQQYYPSTNTYAPKLILPYIKGPDDKPLKPPSDKVFAVVR